MIRSSPDDRHPSNAPPWARRGCGRAWRAAFAGAPAAALLLLASGSAAQDLRIGLPQADSFSFRAPGGRFVANLPIFAPDTVVTVNVVGTSVRSEEGREAEVAYRVRGGDDLGTGAWRIPDRSIATLELSGRLPAVGSYRGAFTLRGAEPITRTYVVRWDRAPLPAALLVAGGVVASAPSLSERVVPFSMHDTANTPMTARVGVDSLRLLRSSEVALAVTPGRMTLVENGTTLDSLAVDLVGGGSRQLTLRMDGLTDPGTYAASLRLERAGFTAATAPVRIYVRRPWWLAGLLILVGILVAEGLRWYNERRRPTLDRQGRIASHLEGLGATEKRLGGGGEPPPPEGEVIDYLRERLLELYSDPTLGTTEDADARITDLKTRVDLLPGWVNARRRVAAVTPARLRPALERFLEPVRSYLLQAGTATDEQRDAARAVVTGASDRVRAARKAWLEEEVAALRTTAEMGVLGTPADGVLRELEAARTKAEAEDLTAAERHLNAARVAYADILAETLRSRLDQKPDWFQAPDWNALVSQIKDALKDLPADDHEARVQAASRAFGSYLREMAAALATTAESLMQASVTAEEKVQLEAARDSASNARLAAAANDHAKAASELEAARQAWERYQALKTGTLGTARADAHPGIPGPIPEALPEAPAPRFVAPVAASAAEVYKRIGRWDAVVAMVTAAIAVLLGINLLWAPDLTWGTDTDIVVALLWGLGLQQVGNETFRGLGHLVERIQTGT